MCNITKDPTKATFIYGDITFKVSFNVCGKFLPATMLNPAESPELEVLDIYPVSYINEDGEKILILEKDRELFKNMLTLTREEIEVICWDYLDSLEGDYE